MNALADQIVDRDAQDRAVPVTAAHVEAAKETILLERRTHIDSLIARLHEPRVRKILDPMLAGETTAGDVLDDDFAYVIGLGLLRKKEGVFEIANPIYREVIPRALTYVRQGQIRVQPAAFVRADGALDMARLMTEWQAFWRKDGHLAAEGFPYRESGPHLMLMAFLQRVVFAGAEASARRAEAAGPRPARPSPERARENTHGGGRIEREYGLGRGAVDLCIEWKGARYAVEIKLRRDTETESEGAEQLAWYLETLGEREGWLVLFDLRSGQRWDERLSNKEIVAAGKVVHVVGC